MGTSPSTEIQSGWLDIAPLRRIVEGRRMSLPRGGDGERLRKSYYRALRRGKVTVTAADELTVGLLGVHPYEVWGDAWLDA